MSTEVVADAPAQVEQPVEAPVEAKVKAPPNGRPLALQRITHTLEMSLLKFLKRPSKAMVTKWNPIVKATVLPREDLEHALAAVFKTTAYEINGEKHVPYPFVKGEAIDVEKLCVSVQLLPVLKGNKLSLSVQFCAKE